MTNAIIKGSLGAISHATNASLAESFLNVDALIVVDISYSMNTQDVPREGRLVKRWDEAKRQLEMLQSSLPGHIALVAFSDGAFFVPSGQLPEPISSTNMVTALKFIKIADDCGIRLILISDGEPDNPSGTLKLASQFKSKIDTIFIGSPKDTSGQDFLRKLSACTGGIYTTRGEIGLLQLNSTIQKLLEN